jgi:hypothetical protein
MDVSFPLRHVIISFVVTNDRGDVRPLERIDPGGGIQASHGSCFVKSKKGLSEWQEI